MTKSKSRDPRTSAAVETASLLKAVADPDRLKIVESLRKRHWACFNWGRMQQLEPIGMAIYKRLHRHFSNLYETKANARGGMVAGYAANFALLSLLFYGGRRYGLTALLTAAMTSFLLPAAAFAALHLDWLPGSFALRYSPARWPGVPVPAEANENCLPDSFMALRNSAMLA